MKLVPLGDKLIVRRLEAEETTSGGIVLPEGAREKPKQGRVLSVGDGRLAADGMRVELGVHDGDRVLFNRYAGTEVKIDNEEFLIMSEDEVLAILEGVA
ncbi:MAG: co-chaperone GroES [Pirellulales bacterium]|nr:co-chaperone GroES [Pirellulales bacterium]